MREKHFADPLAIPAICYAAQRIEAAPRASDRARPSVRKRG